MPALTNQYLTKGAEAAEVGRAYVRKPSSIRKIREYDVYEYVL